MAPRKTAPKETARVEALPAAGALVAAAEPAAVEAPVWEAVLTPLIEVVAVAAPDEADAEEEAGTSSAGEARGVEAPDETEELEAVLLPEMLWALTA